MIEDTKLSHVRKVWNAKDFEWRSLYLAVLYIHKKSLQKLLKGKSLLGLAQKLGLKNFEQLTRICPELAVVLMERFDGEDFRPLFYKPILDKKSRTSFGSVFTIQ